MQLKLWLQKGRRWPVHPTGIWVGVAWMWMWMQDASGKRQDARLRFLPRFLRLPLSSNSNSIPLPLITIIGFIHEGNGNGRRNGDWWVGRRPSGGSLANCCHCRRCFPLLFCLPIVRLCGAAQHLYANATWTAFVFPSTVGRKQLVVVKASGRVQLKFFKKNIFIHV